MNVSVYTMLIAIIASSIVLYPIAWIVSLLQFPALWIKNYYISKYWQILIGVIGVLFQVYLLCGIPAYYYAETNNMTSAILSFVLIVILLLTNFSKDNDSTIDEIQETTQSVNAYTGLISLIPIYLILFTAPDMIWSEPTLWFINACEWVLHIPVVGFIIKLFLGGVACYYLIMAIIGVGALVYAGFNKIKEWII